MECSEGGAFLLCLPGLYQFVCDRRWGGVAVLEKRLDSGDRGLLIDGSDRSVGRHMVPRREPLGFGS